MAEFTDLDLPTDPRETYEQLLDRYTAVFGAPPAAASPITAILQAVAFNDAELAQYGLRIHEQAFGTFAARLVGIERHTGRPATCQATWTVRDTAGYNIPASELVTVYRRTGTDMIVLRPVGDLHIPAGQTTVTIDMMCDQIGAATNGLPAAPLELAVADARITSAATTSTTAGGIDPETDREFVDRAAQLLGLSTLMPILPHDFAVLARTVEGVHRAKAAGRYNGSNGAANSAGHVTVWPLTTDGTAVPAATKTELAALLTASGQHPAGYTVHILDPASVAVAVAISITVAAGHDTDTVRAAVIGTITDMLHPSTWAGGLQSPPIWDATHDTVTVNSVIIAAGHVEGVATVGTVTLNGATTDIPIATNALPAPTITVTAT